MELQVIIKLAIEVVAIFVPSIITLLTLSKKKYYKKTLDGIQEKIQVMSIESSYNFQKIKQELDTHNVALQHYVFQQETAKQIRQINKQALTVTDSATVKKVLTKFTEEFVNFVRCVLDIGFDNLAKQQLLSKIDLISDNTNAYTRGIMQKEDFDGWLKVVEQIIVDYSNSVIDIFQDQVNNKNDRFIIKSLDVTHKVVKQFILYYLSIQEEKYKQ